MPLHRFHWNRKRYRKAQHLSRFFGRWVYDLPSDPPELLRRFYELWERHPQRDDPLLTPFEWRRHSLDRDEIPF
jgi:hypothetical protein